MRINDVVSIVKFQWGFVLFIILVIIYFYNYRKQSEFLKVASLVIAGQGIVGVCCICYNVIFDTQWCDLTQLERSYVLVGGLATIWNIWNATINAIKKPVPQAPQIPL